MPWLNAFETRPLSGNTMGKVGFIILWQIDFVEIVSIWINFINDKLTWYTSIYNMWNNIIWALIKNNF